jgi:hypothetical protein
MRLILILFLAFSLKFLYSQETYYLKELQTKTRFDGNVKQLYEDKFGMIWLLTYDRLIRYDGNDFEVFDEIIKPDLRLKNAWLIKNMFLLNYDNHDLKIFDIKTLKLQKIQLPKEILNSSYIQMCGNFIFISDKETRKLFVCQYISNEIKLNYIINNIYVEDVTAINDTMIIARNYFKSTIISFTKGTYIIGAEIKQLATSLETIDNYILFKDNTDVYLYNIIDKTVKIIRELHGNYNIYKDHDDIYVFSSDNDYHLTRNNLQIQKVNLFTPLNSRKDWARTILIYSTASGKKFLVNSNGMYLLIASDTSFNKFLIINYLSKNRYHTSVRSINYDQKHSILYLGLDNENGILKSNFNINKNQDYKFNSFRLPTTKDGSLTNTINTIFIDSNEVIFGTLTEAFRIKDNHLNNTGFEWCRDIYKDKLGQYWVTGGSYRFYKKKLNGDIHVFWIKNKNDTLVYNNSRPNDIIRIREREMHTSMIDFKTWDIEAFKNYFFISSTRGLLTFDRQTEEFIETSNFLKINDSITAPTWYSKVVGHFLFVATQGEGVHKIDLLTGTHSNPIPDLKNSFMIESFDNQNIWIVSTNKLIYLREDGEYFELPVENYPLPDELAFHGLCKLNQELFLVAGKSGFSVINARKIIEKVLQTPWQTIIKEYKINDIIYGSYIEDKANIELPFDSNSICLEICNSLLDNADQMKLKYKLIGFDANYTETSGINTINYKNLPPGSYTLIIYSRNHNALWGKNPISLKIIVNPPWYLNLYSKIFYVLITLGLAFLLSHTLLNRIEQKKNAELTLLESELKAIRAQINPHFMFNALNSIQSFIMQNDRVEANNYLTVFSQLVRKILDMSSKDLISIDQEVSWMKDYLSLEGLRFEDKLIWEITIDPMVNAEDEIPSMILQPIIENALIHGLFPKEGSGKLIIKYSHLTKLMVLCEVIDNGVGRTVRHKVYESKGLKLINDRLDFINKRYNCSTKFNVIDLLDNEGKPMGTHVKLVLPVIKNLTNS